MAAGAEILCIVGQKRAAVAAYFAKLGYTFPILIDETREVIQAFDVFHALSFDAYRIARPSLFLIDRNGQIAYRYVGRNQADNPPSDVQMRELADVLARVAQQDESSR